MPHFALVFMQILVLAEPLLTAVALLAFLRSRPQPDLPAMRDYLAVRLAFAVVILSILFSSRFLPLGPTTIGTCYFYLWLINCFAVTWFLFRVAANVVSLLLEPLPGLRRLSMLLYRWIAVVAAFLLVPATIALIPSLVHRRPMVELMMQFTRALSEAQWLPLIFAIPVATRRRLSPSSRLFGILAGLCLEPTYGLFRSWFYDPRLWGWNNLYGQIVTDGALILWSVYFLKPESRRQLAPPGETALRWDKNAQHALKRRQILLPQPLFHPQRLFSRLHASK